MSPEAYAKAIEACREIVASVPPKASRKAAKAAQAAAEAIAADEAMRIERAWREGPHEGEWDLHTSSGRYVGMIRTFDGMFRPAIMPIPDSLGRIIGPLKPTVEAAKAWCVDECRKHKIEF